MIFHAHHTKYVRSSYRGRSMNFQWGWGANTFLEENRRHLGTHTVRCPVSAKNKGSMCHGHPPRYAPALLPEFPYFCSFTKRCQMEPKNVGDSLTMLGNLVSLDSCFT